MPLSFYFGIADSDGIEKIVKPEKRRHFYLNLHKWLPTDSCNKHRSKWLRKILNNCPWIMKACCKMAHKLDCVTPLKFKVEHKGRRAVSLCSKAYYIDGPEGPKMAAKGLGRSSNNVTFDHFYHCLVKRQNCIGKNQGFMKRFTEENGFGMVTYEKEQPVISFFYMKRLVEDDLITCSPTKA